MIISLKIANIKKLADHFTTCVRILHYEIKIY